MNLTQTLLAELEQESHGTRKTLERLPEVLTDWKPHTKSFGMDYLASHVASIPDWAVKAVDLHELDLAPPGQEPEKMKVCKSRAEVLEEFEKHNAAAHAALSRTNDAELAKPWSLLHGGHTLLTMPRSAVLRNFVLNHIVHHRAQLGVYLRLNDLPVPAIYGPSADESPM